MGIKYISCYAFMRDMAADPVVKDLLEWNKVTVDNALFRLHYRFSTLGIIGAIIVYTLVGCWHGTITCFFSNGTLTRHMSFYKHACFTGFMYTVQDIPPPNVTSALELEESYTALVGLNLDPSQKIRHHDNYIFIPFILLMQFVIFYFPRYVWQTYEGGKVEMLCGRFIDYKNNRHMLHQDREMDKDEAKNKSRTEAEGDKDNDKDKDEKKNKIGTEAEVDMVAEYIVASLGYHGIYSFAYAFCELLNLAGVILQIYLTDIWARNAFTGFGPKVLQDSLYAKTGPLENAFPTLAKCTVDTVGPGGNVVPHSGICSLPLNLVNKLYFTYFWFYLVFLIAANTANTIYRFVSIGSFRIRNLIIQDLAVTIPRTHLRSLLKKFQYGDYFLLCLLAENLEAHVFNDIVQDIIFKLKIDGPTLIHIDQVDHEEIVEVEETEEPEELKEPDEMA